VPLVKRAQGWIFDTAAGKDEVLSRRIGRNELAVLRLGQTYVRAQTQYASRGHDGKPAGSYARRFSSDPGTENGLYWEQKPGGARSPLGDLVAEAAAEGRAIGPGATGPSPFHGYYFKILEGQGAAAAGGAKSYVVKDQMTGGFAMIAWPSQPDVTGVMTFMVSKDGVVYEKSFGAGTQAAVAAITRFNPDKSWAKVIAHVPAK
jgi:hypothetical protein